MFALLPLWSVGNEPSGGAKSSPGAAKTATPFSTQAPKETSASIPAFSGLKVGSDIGGWTFQPLRGVRKATQYSLVSDSESNQIVVEGRASSAAAALGVRLDLDPKQHRVLRFKWKVGNLIESSDPRYKEGDDDSARVYVTFIHDPSRSTFRERTENALFRTLYGETPPRAALSYVFSHKAKQGDVIVSPFSSRVKKIVVDGVVSDNGK